MISVLTAKYFTGNNKILSRTIDDHFAYLANEPVDDQHDIKLELFKEYKLDTIMKTIKSRKAATLEIPPKV